MRKSPTRSDGPKLNILVAYPYFKNDLARAIAEHHGKIRLLIDSGAFSAWRIGKTISLDDYCAFIADCPAKPWRYFMLDVVGNPAATEANYREMLRRKLAPIPIFTRGERIEALDEYYRTSDVVGIGGLVKTPKNKGFVNGIMRHVAGRRVHLLGFVNIESLKYWKPYSCDSNGWDQSKYGQIRLYLGNGSFRYVQRHTLPRDIEAQQRLRRYGIDPNILGREEEWRADGASYRANLKSMVHAALDVEKHLGTMLFLVPTGGNDVHAMIAALDEFTGAKK